MYERDHIYYRAERTGSLKPTIKKFSSPFPLVLLVKVSYEWGRAQGTGKGMWKGTGGEKEGLSVKGECLVLKSEVILMFSSYFEERLVEILKMVLEGLRRQHAALRTTWVRGANWTFVLESSSKVQSHFYVPYKNCFFLTENTCHSFMKTNQLISKISTNNVKSFLIYLFLQMLYMFQAVSPPIIRST